MNSLMRRGQVLCCRGFNDPRLQSKALRQRDARLCFEAVEHRLLIRDPARNLIVAMFAITQGKDAPVGNLLPKLNVAKWPKPRPHIFNVFKNNHETRVPQH